MLLNPFRMITARVCRFVTNWIFAFVYLYVYLASIIKATLILVKKRDNKYAQRQHESKEELYKYYKEHFPSHFQQTCDTLATCASSTAAYNENKSKALINRLPNEVLYKIFDLLEMDDLSRATAVNKRWHKVINPILWKSVIPDAALISCVPAFAMADRKYKTTHFHPKSHISPRFSFHKPQYGIAVRSLDLTHISFSVTDCYIRHIASYCPNLLYLNLSECHYLTDDSLFYISRCLPSLETLILQGCYLITDKGLSVLAANQKNLVTVNLGGCTGITENGVINLLTSTCTSSSSDNGKQKSSSIRRLWLNDCRFKKTRILLQQIGRTCNTRLEWLDIARCGHDGGKEGDTDYDYGNLLHHSDIEQLILACPNVTRLNLGMKPIKEESAITALMNAHEAEDHPFNELTHLLQRFNLEPSLSQTSQHTLRDHRLRMNARQIQLQQRDVISSDTVTFIITHLTKLERLDLSRWRCLSEKVMHTLSLEGQTSGRWTHLNLTGYSPTRKGMAYLLDLYRQYNSNIRITIRNDEILVPRFRISRRRHVSSPVPLPNDEARMDFSSVGCSSTSSSPTVSPSSSTSRISITTKIGNTATLLETKNQSTF